MSDRLSEIRDDRGHSLLALVSVVITLAVLVVIVLFAVGSHQDRAVRRLGSTHTDALHSECAAVEKSVEFAAEAIHATSGAYPRGTVDATTNPNPLLMPAAGAMLRSYPTSPAYSLQYVGAVGGGNYQINVLNKAGTSVGQGAAGCAAL
jgi:Tfp pilus assembly protein PilE